MPEFFGEKLVESDVDPDPERRGRIKSFESDPNILIKSFPAKDLVRDNGAIAYFEGVQSPFEAAMLAIELYEELKAAYGIPAIPGAFILKKDAAGKELLYTQTERMEGQTLAAVAEEGFRDSGFLEELRRLYASIARYLIDKYKKKEHFLSDVVHPDQYLYGPAAPGSKERHIRLIDIDPRFVTKSDVAAFISFGLLAQTAGNWEEKHPGLAFDEARDALRSFVSQLSPKERRIFSNSIEKIERFVNGRPAAEPAA